MILFDDTYYMRIALEEARKAFDMGEIPIGSVIVWGNKIIARAHNLVEQLQDATAHAEMLAITAATQVIGAKYLMEATLYTTVEPCLMCCGAIAWSKIGHIIYATEDIKNGYRKYTKDNWPFHPRATLQKGILQEEAAQLMKDFFQTRR